MLGNYKIMSDGDLRILFKKHMPEAHWQPIESWSTGQGVPDVEYCFPGGACGWVENKISKGWQVVIRPHQVAWLERRVRAGGRCFVAIRRKSSELWIFHGKLARILAADGIEQTHLYQEPALLACGGGPAAWNWGAVRRILTA